MDYCFKDLENLKIVGIKRKYSNGREMQQDIPDFWQEVNNKQLTEEIIEKSNHKLSGILGICRTLENGALEYIIGVPTNQNIDNESVYEMIALEAQTYIVFEAVGKVPQAVKETIAQIHQNVLPKLDVSVKSAPLFEHYLPGNTQSDDYITEIWIPISR
ncbi:GyrI-like domain-containing protein [Staphylococcus sp. NRL 16/872]|uniref:GyrI-like domain-containing protein n=1 Tax=Staphylococcus sp. NRL 16/872 TaxID=2930131 RepID=UPI001FB36A55|nr:MULTISPECIES: GyrI-like domain-containing protein [unclassified Staphylococcus]MCJ1655644.1 GyrI-like domain-containing protein [Staphylococcus sp. NRL 21/187]MCJ1661466.1 GyrI-like domain-containing protein [Staphylococcus sp. NRL 18/288]MCJ1667369.1 GyrI-like domain-containing protein [Staphylococcus sp. NRL 19/737]WEN69850.1 GyrI-like domain-containing protein [Staphylococcus sp. NRL 16/872]